MNASPPPKGIYVPVPTFFKDTASSALTNYGSPLDLDSQCKHAVFLAQAGIRGIVLLGSTGEAVHLTNQERQQIISTVRAALTNAGFAQYPILAGTASQNIQDVYLQLSDAKEAGAHWGLVLAPGFFANAVSQNGLATWFEKIADLSPIPILVYHYPAVSNNVKLQPKTIERLAQHNNIVGCKLSHGNLDDHALVSLSPQIQHSSFHTFTGLGQQLIGVLDVSGAGAIDGLAGCFPRVLVKLYDLFEAREQGVEGMDLAKLGVAMRGLQYKICQGEKLVAAWGSLGVKEVLRRLMSIGSEKNNRWPLEEHLPESEWGAFKEAIEALQEEETRLSQKSEP